MDNRDEDCAHMVENMTLDGAIKHCEEVISTTENEQCRRDHVQLKEWLVELKEFKNLIE